MKFTELGHSELLDIQIVMEDFVKAVEEHGEIDDDGDIKILVGDEDMNHEMVWIKPEELKAMKKFIESTLN